MIRGIGPVYGKKMVQAFAEKVFDIIETEPDRLQRGRRHRASSCPEPHCGPGREQKILREIIVFLHHGVGTARAVPIYKTYGVDAVQVMTDNPYRLAREIRFKTVDAIAIRLEISRRPR
jgi:exodeoxyribonuclease V alpha subunit